MNMWQRVIWRVLSLLGVYENRKTKRILCRNLHNVFIPTGLPQERKQPIMSDLPTSELVQKLKTRAISIQIDADKGDIPDLLRAAADRLNLQLAHEGCDGCSTGDCPHSDLNDCVRAQARVITEQAARLSALDASSPTDQKIVHIVLENEGGVYTPAITTWSVDAARSKYVELMKSQGPLAEDLIPKLKNIITGEEGFEHGFINGWLAIKIDGVWYDAEDDMGDVLAMWFKEKVIE